MEANSSTIQEKQSPICDVFPQEVDVSVNSAERCYLIRLGFIHMIKKLLAHLSQDHVPFYPSLTMASMWKCFVVFLYQTFLRSFEAMKKKKHPRNAAVSETKPRKKGKKPQQRLTLNSISGQQEVEEMLQPASKNAGLTNESIYSPDFGHLVLSHQ